MRVPSGFNISVWRSRFILKANYDDIIVCELLEYGFPSGFDSIRLPKSTSKNHGGALGYAEHVDEFLRKERQLGAILRPFSKNPLDSFLMTSPLNTVEKKSYPGARRVIVDLSSPLGMSLNNGIDTDVYLGERSTVHYPSLDDLFELVVSLCTGSHL